MIEEKRCTSCLKTNRLSEFYKEKRAKDGKTSQCKKCMLDQQFLKRNGYPRPQHVLSEGTKKCSKCKTIKPFANFRKNKKGKNGFDPKCKECHREYRISESGKSAQKRYRQSPDGREKRRNHDRVYRKTEHRKKYNREYSKTDKVRARTRAYQKSNKYKSYQKEYSQRPEVKKRNNEKSHTRRGRAIRVHNESLRRTRKTQAGGSYTITEWFNLCKFYDFYCLSCNQQFPFDQLTVDHIKPVSKGGTSFIWNLQPLCKSCNSRKGAKEIDFRQTLPDWIKRDHKIYNQLSLF